MITCSYDHMIICSLDHMMRSCDFFMSGHGQETGNIINHFSGQRLGWETGRLIINFGPRGRERIGKRIFNFCRARRDREVFNSLPVCYVDLFKRIMLVFCSTLHCKQPLVQCLFVAIKESRLIQIWPFLFCTCHLSLTRTVTRQTFWPDGQKFFEVDGRLENFRVVLSANHTAQKRRKQKQKLASFSTKTIASFSTTTIASFSTTTIASSSTTTIVLPGRQRHMLDLLAFSGGHA